MSHAQLNDVGHKNALTRGDIVAATAIAQFYNFASRCMNWPKTTRSLQERALYVQMGLQWLAAGARLQTFLQFMSSQDVSPIFVLRCNRSLHVIRLTKSGLVLLLEPRRMHKKSMA